MRRNIQTIESDLAADIRFLADGHGVIEHERTVSVLHCTVCGATEKADGIFAHLLFEHDHTHGGN